MIITQSTHERFVSNSFLVANEDTGNAIIIDTGAPMQPLLNIIDSKELSVVAIFNTHDHHDHTLNNVDWLGRFDCDLHTADLMEDGQEFSWDGLDVTVIATPGHTTEHAALLVNGEYVATGDALFAGSVGGTINGGETAYTQLEHSIATRLMGLDDSVKVLPGHASQTTIGTERETNPFVRYWTENETTHDETVHVAGREARLLVEAPDYDGGTKALVTFNDDGTHAIVGGSTVEKDAKTAIMSNS